MTEIIIILLIVVIIFGAGKLPELGKGLGKGIRNFKKAVTGNDEVDIDASSRQKEIDSKEIDDKD
jgi:sec-independent protein translocase protein TatA